VLQLIYLTIIAHEALVKHNILHRDISLTNLALSCDGKHNYGAECSPDTPQRGILIDFDYAIWLNDATHTISKTDKTVCNNYVLYHAYADVPYTLGYTPIHCN